MNNKKTIDPNKLMPWPSFEEKARVRICTITSSGNATRHIALELPITKEQENGGKIPNVLESHGFALTTTQGRNFYIFKKPTVKFHEQSLNQWAQALFLPKYISTNIPIREIYLPGVINFSINQELQRARAERLNTLQSKDDAVSTLNDSVVESPETTQPVGEVAGEVKSAEEGNDSAPSESSNAESSHDDMASEAPRAPTDQTSIDNNVSEPTNEPVDENKETDLQHEQSAQEDTAVEGSTDSLNQLPFELEVVDLKDKVEGHTEDTKTTATEGKKAKVEDVGEFLQGARKNTNNGTLTAEEIKDSDLDTLRNVVRRDSIWPALSAEEAREQGFSLFGYIFYKKLRSLVSTVPRLSLSGYEGRNLARSLRIRGEAEAHKVYLETVQRIRDVVESISPIDLGDRKENKFDYNRKEAVRLLMTISAECYATESPEFDEDGELRSWGGSSAKWDELSLTALADLKKFTTFSYVRTDLNKKFFLPFQVKIKDIEKLGLDKDVSFSLAEIDEATIWADVLAGKRARKRDSSSGQSNTSSDESAEAEESLEEERQTVGDMRRTQLLNLPYTGPNFLEGKNFSGSNFAEEFMNTFGLKGVQFGNWLTESEKLEFVKRAYQSCMLMCQVVGIAPQSFGLGGTLGIAFGSQGRKGAAAHYNPAYKKINLTRFSGDGSLAHEWAHALDNYLYDRVAKPLTRNPQEPDNFEQIDITGPSRISLLSDSFTSKSRIGRSAYFHFTGIHQEFDNLIESVRFHPEFRRRDYSAYQKEAQVIVDFKHLVHSLFDRPIAIKDEITNALHGAKRVAGDALHEILAELKRAHPEMHSRAEQEFKDKVPDGSSFYYYNIAKAGHEWCKEWITRNAMALMDDPSYDNKAFIEACAQEYFIYSDWVNQHAGLENDFTPFREFLSKNPDFVETMPKKVKLRGSKFSAILTDFNEYSKYADKRKSGKMYYATPVEMVARSFETYIAKTLKNNGFRDDFLVQESKLEGDVYPKGQYGDIIFKNWEKFTTRLDLILEPSSSPKITLDADQLDTELDAPNDTIKPSI